jgi:hypothetical protein
MCHENFKTPNSRKMENTVSDTHTLGFLQMGDQFTAEANSYKMHTRLTRRKSAPSLGLKPTIPGTERLQTHAFDRTATGSVATHDSCVKICTHSNKEQLLMGLCYCAMSRSHLRSFVRQIQIQTYF